MTIWVVVLVTVDRYIAICMPLRSKIRTIPRARAAVAAVLISAVVYNIPRFFEKTVLYDKTPATTPPCSTFTVSACDPKKSFVVDATVETGAWKRNAILLVIESAPSREEEEESKNHDCFSDTCVRFICKHIE